MESHELVLSGQYVYYIGLEDLSVSNLSTTMRKRRGPRLKDM